jgi:hypothetical protein
MAAAVSPQLTHHVDTRRNVHESAGDSVVLWTARRVEFDHRQPCACGAPRRLVSEREISTGAPLPQWILVSVTCSNADCTLG